MDGGETGEGGGREEGGGEEGEEEEGDMLCVPLESLGLGGNKIGDVGAQHLASGLASNTSEIYASLISHDVHVTHTGIMLCDIVSSSQFSVMTTASCHVIVM